MSKCKPTKQLACGCWLGHERCFDCRPGVDFDQEKAISITVGTRNDIRNRKMTPWDWALVAIVVGVLAIYWVADICWIMR